MRDTPRTNKAQFPADIAPRCPAGYQEQVVDADFAREMERENAELLDVAIWHRDMLDLGDVAFFERHGFNVSEVMPRTRAAITKAKGGAA